MFIVSVACFVIFKDLIRVESMTCEINMGDRDEYR